MVFRYLRTLEGVSPPLSLTHLSCQTTAKAFVATRTSLFLRCLSFTCLYSPVHRYACLSNCVHN